ncbi:hypothetical protein Tco_0840363 [Tanacetum coccineum]|uniref:Uncharacterized protein n=1 Tax=Tanacetum coccineum TaxID=301880 RepID=A0ABQ5ATB5_9ASTR
MFLNMDQLQKQLDNNEFQEIGSMASFKVLETQFRPHLDEEQQVRVQTENAEFNVFAYRHNKTTEQPEINNEDEIQKKGFAIAALKNELRKLTGNSVNTKFAKPSILGKPVGQPLKNQSVVRQPTAFKSERPRISKQRFASQVDNQKDLSKTLISAVVCTSAIGSSSEMGLISASSTCASFPDLLLVSCSCDSVLLHSMITELASNAYANQPFPLSSDQMKGFVDQLERLGYVLPHDLIVGLILNGLTKDFSGFVRNYNMALTGGRQVGKGKANGQGDDACTPLQEVGLEEELLLAVLAELLKRKRRRCLQLAFLIWFQQRRLDKTPYELWYGKVPISVLLKELIRDDYNLKQFTVFRLNGGAVALEEFQAKSTTAMSAIRR